jgi:uncharacterized protein YcbX
MEIVCPRCVMVIRGFKELPGDPAAMRALVRESEGNLRIYARAGKPGRVRVGHEVERID